MSMYVEKSPFVDHFQSSLPGCILIPLLLIFFPTLNQGFAKLYSKLQETFLIDVHRNPPEFWQEFVEKCLIHF